MAANTVGNPLTKGGTGILFSNGLLRPAAILILLVTAPVYEAFRGTGFSNGDIWWHLRTGLWIIQNHAVPRYGLFSQYPDNPWIDSNWLFDILAAGTYKIIGLRSVLVILMGFKLALAAVTFLLAYVGRRNFWIAILLSVAAQYVLVDLQPLPILFSTLFFGVELILLLQSRRTGSVRPLVWLPLLFLCWANLHPQYVLGLVLLGLFLLAGTLEQWLHRSGFGSFTPPAVPISKTLAIAGIAVAATMANPYGFRLFPEIIHSVYSKVQFHSFGGEMNAMAFRRPQDFLLLLLVMAAYLALGRQRSRDLFKIMTMSLFAMLAFRVQRDVWLIVLPAIAVLADAIPQFQYEIGLHGNAQARKWKLGVVAALVLVSLAAAIHRLPGDEALLKVCGRVFPVKACDYIRANQLPGPIFNSYSWGGFLTWYLPEYPVAIDGRLSLYGDEKNERYFKVIGGTMRLEDDPSFAQARVILIEQDSGMAKALTTLPVLRQQFRVVYQDHVAVVLIRIPQGF